MKPATSNLAYSWSLPRPIIKCYQKKWVWPWAREALKILGFPCNISATAEAIYFKFDMQLGLAKAHHENNNQRKSGPGLALESSQHFWGSPSMFL